MSYASCRFDAKARKGTSLIRDVPRESTQCCCTRFPPRPAISSSGNIVSKIEVRPDHGRIGRWPPPRRDRQGRAVNRHGHTHAEGCVGCFGELAKRAFFGGPRLPETLPRRLSEIRQLDKSGCFQGGRKGGPKKSAHRRRISRSRHLPSEWASLAPSTEHGVQGGAVRSIAKGLGGVHHVYLAS